MSDKTIIIIFEKASGKGKALYDKLKGNGNHIGILPLADMTDKENIVKTLSLLHGELGQVDIFILCTDKGDIKSSFGRAVKHPSIDTNTSEWPFVINTIYQIFEQQELFKLVDQGTL